MSDFPYTIGYDIDKALSMLGDVQVRVIETSTPFQDKMDERKDHTPVVVRQVIEDGCIYLTVARFK